MIVIDLADFVLKHALREGATTELDDAGRFFSNERGAAGAEHVVVGPTEQVISAGLLLVGQSDDELRTRVVIIVAFCVSVVERCLSAYVPR